MISVIIPMYNVENTISRAIESVLRNSYTDFELLLIDDGSTDNTLKLCEDYASKDNRISLFQREHRGVSAARNYGIAQAKGEYICFVDSDDEIVESYLSELLSFIESLELDGSFCGYMKLNGDPSESGKAYTVFDETKIFSENEIEKFIDTIFVSFHKTNTRLFSSCMAMFKTQILLDYAIRFNELVHYGEDSLFLYRYLNACKKVGYVNKPLYIYHTSGVNQSTILPCGVLPTIEEFEKERVTLEKPLSENMERYYFCLLRDYLTLYVYGKNTEINQKRISQFKNQINNNKTVLNVVKHLNENLVRSMHDKIELIVLKHRLFYLGALLRKAMHFIK